MKRRCKLWANTVVAAIVTSHKMCGTIKVRGMIRSLDEAVAAREPLIEIVVRFKEGVDCDLATAAVNSLGPDIELHPGHWYNNPRWLIGQVTAEGALRLFGARFTRVPLEHWNPQTRSYDGVHDNSFRWSFTKITRWPCELAAYVEGIGISQPGANDDTQPYVPLFER
jgi:hypothetical protein